MSELMKIENVDFSYSDGKQALTNVNMSVYAGEKLAVMGANGAGKSTLFLNMNGILRPSAGQIFFDGVPGDLWEKRIDCTEKKSRDCFSGS